MAFDVRDHDGVAVISSSGDLDATSGPELEKALERLLGDGRRNVLVNLNGTSFVDSAGLATLVKALKRLRAAGGKLFLAELTPAVRRVFELTRLDRAFELFSSEGEGVQKL